MHGQGNRVFDAKESLRVGPCAQIERAAVGRVEIDDQCAAPGGHGQQRLGRVGAHRGVSDRRAAFGIIHGDPAGRLAALRLRQAGRSCALGLPYPKMVRRILENAEEVPLIMVHHCRVHRRVANHVEVVGVAGIEPETAVAALYDSLAIPQREGNPHPRGAHVGVRPVAGRVEAQRHLHQRLAGAGLQPQSPPDGVHPFNRQFAGRNNRSRVALALQPNLAQAWSCFQYLLALGINRPSVIAGETHRLQEHAALSGGAQNRLLPDDQLFQESGRRPIHGEPHRAVVHGDLVRAVPQP